MLKLLVGLALLPSAAFILGAAGGSLGALVFRQPQSSFPFLAGFGFTLLAWFSGRFLLVAEGGPWNWFGRAARGFYVFGHEATHVLAAWSVGGKVFGFRVGQEGGHVDLSHSSAFIALAPYCLPVYTMLVLVGYRLLLWLRPDFSGHVVVFLILMGFTLSFHLINTFDSLWRQRQPDLKAAGGAIFSLACIAIANGLVLLVLLKMLFPRGVSLIDSLSLAGGRSLHFWSSAYAASKRMASGLERF